MKYIEPPSTKTFGLELTQPPICKLSKYSRVQKQLRLEATLWFLALRGGCPRMILGSTALEKYLQRFMALTGVRFASGRKLIYFCEHQAWPGRKQWRQKTKGKH